MKRATTLWLICGALLLGTVFFIGGWIQPIGDGIRFVLAPAARVFAWFGQSAGSLLGPEAFSDHALIEQNRELQARLTSLTVNYAQCSALQEEVESLRAQAHFLERSGFDSVGAHVIGREISNDRAHLLIDRGNQDHVEIGQAVVTDDGVLVGKVVQIREQVASVELLSDSESRVAVAFSGSKTVGGVLEGRGNGASVMTYIPSSATALQNQLVVTAGLEEKIPANLPVGMVSEVQGKSTDPFFSAVIEPFVRVDLIRTVSVLRPHSAGSAL